MSVVDKNQTPAPSSTYRKKRRVLSPEKKFQLFLEAQRGETQLGELFVAKDFIPPTWPGSSAR